MGERVDEIKGRTRESVGDLTGNEQMKREGQAEAVTAKVKRETEAAIDKTVGKAQETWGELADDEETEARGKARQAEGELKSVG